MNADNNALAVLTAKDQIRELVQLYSRAADRRDSALLRSLYTEDGVESHAGTPVPANDLVALMERNSSRVSYMGHHVCNHLISVDGAAEAHGEVYSIAPHVVLGGDNTAVADVMMLRYLDRYRRENGRWLFAQRDVIFDYRIKSAVPVPEAVIPEKDDSYAILPSLLFARGAHR